MQAVQLQLSTRAKMNNQLMAKEIEQYCPLSSKDQQFLAKAMEKLGLSARSYHRVLKLARTIADLGLRATIEREDLLEALSYRDFWRSLATENLY
jgi:magnesium chelatase family protein